MAAGTKIIWTSEMLKKMEEEFAFRFNIDLAKEMGIGLRTVVRKARELGLDKEPFFVVNNIKEMTRRAVIHRGENPTTGLKGWSVPNGEKTRFKNGHPSPMKDPEILKKAVDSRNDTIRIERLRMKYGLDQETKLRLNPNN